MEIYLIVADAGAYSDRTWEPVCAYASLAEAEAAATDMREKYAIYRKSYKEHCKRRDAMAMQMRGSIIGVIATLEEYAEIDAKLGPLPTWDHNFPPADEYVIETVTLHTEHTLLVPAEPPDTIPVVPEDVVNWAYKAQAGMSVVANWLLQQNTRPKRKPKP